MSLRLLFRDLLAEIRKDPVARGCFGGIVFIMLIAFIGPLIAPYGNDEQNISLVWAKPSLLHPFGTDNLGRDQLTRLIFGTRVSMSIALVTSVVAIILGTAYGAVSGYAGGRTDGLMMRVVDVFYSLPDLLVIILFTVIMERGVMSILVALSVVSWVSVARIVRGEVMKLKNEEFVIAAQALGVRSASIVIKHILPNTMGPIIVTLTFRIPSMILAESTLSFIGLGVEPPNSSWGTLANEGWKHIQYNPHMILFPALAITLSMLAFNLLGDFVRDALDPRTKR